METKRVFMEKRRRNLIRLHHCFVAMRRKRLRQSERGGGAEEGDVENRRGIWRKTERVEESVTET